MLIESDLDNTEMEVKPGESANRGANCGSHRPGHYLHSKGQAEGYSSVFIYHTLFCSRTAEEVLAWAPWIIQPNQRLQQRHHILLINVQNQEASNFNKILLFYVNVHYHLSFWPSFLLISLIMQLRPSINVIFRHGLEHKRRSSNIQMTTLLAILLEKKKKKKAHLVRGA